MAIRDSSRAPRALPQALLPSRVLGRVPNWVAAQQGHSCHPWNVQVLWHLSHGPCSLAGRQPKWRHRLTLLVRPAASCRGLLWQAPNPQLVGSLACPQRTGKLAGAQQLPGQLLYSPWRALPQLSWVPRQAARVRLCRARQPQARRGLPQLQMQPAVPILGGMQRRCQAVQALGSALAPTSRWCPWSCPPRR